MAGKAAGRDDGNLGPTTRKRAAPKVGSGRSGQPGSNPPRKDEDAELAIGKPTPPSLRDANLHDLTKFGLTVTLAAAYLLFVVAQTLYLIFGTFDQQKVAVLMIIFNSLNTLISGVFGIYVGKRLK